MDFLLSLHPGPQGLMSAQRAPLRSQPRQPRTPFPEAVPGRLRAEGRTGRGASPRHLRAGARLGLPFGSAPRKTEWSIATHTGSAPSSARLPPSGTAAFVAPFCALFSTECFVFHSSQRVLRAPPVLLCFLCPLFLW